VENAEKNSDKIFDALINDVGKARSIAITYCGSLEGVTRHLESILRISKPEINVLTMHGDYMHNIILPYLSEYMDYVILFSHSFSTTCLQRVYQSLKLLDTRLSIIISQPLQSLEKFLKKDDNTVVEIDERTYRLSVMLANIKLGTRLCGGNNQRIKRMEQEVMLSNIVNDVIRKYGKFIEKPLEFDLIASTYSLLSVAEELGDIGYMYTVIDRLHNFVKFANNIVLFYTTAEEHVAREAVLNIKRFSMQRNIVEVKINTDPLTAPLYGLIMAYYMHLKRSLYNSRGRESIG